MKLYNGNLELHYSIDFWAEIAPRYHYIAGNKKVFASEVVSALHQTVDRLKCYIWQETFLNAFMEIYETIEESYRCLECKATRPEFVDADVRITRTKDEIVVKVPVKTVLRMFVAFGKRNGYQVKIISPHDVMDTIISELGNSSYAYESASCSEVMMVSALRHLAKAADDGNVTAGTNGKKQVIDIGFANLCVEVDEQGIRPEAYIFLESKEDPDDYQEICMVSQAVVPESQEVIPGNVQCLVWTDEQDENYTNRFVIPYVSQFE